MRLATLGCIAATVATQPGTPEHRSFSESAEVYRIAAQVAVPILPEAIRVAFELRQEEFRAAAVAAALLPGPRGGRGFESPHQIVLDAAAKESDVASRRSAARAFPRERDKAMELFQTLHFPGGELPWTIEGRFVALVEAFRSGDSDRVVQAAGALLHFAVDVSLPSHVTRIWLNESLNSDKEFNPMPFLHPTKLVQRLQSRLEFEARVSPDRLSANKTPVDAAMNAALEAYWTVDELVQLEGDVSAEVRSSAVGRPEDETYLRILAERTAPVLEGRIEAGSLLAANLIVGAWTEAGKPVFKSTAPVAAAPTSPATPTAGSFVGSRSSTVFHRPDCSHAARINPQNRVTFETVVQAQSAGRTPCKTCTPDAPRSP